MRRISFVLMALLSLSLLFVYFGCISEEPTSPAETSIGAPASVPPPDHPVKVKLCHIPPGNPENAHVIEISEKGVAAHLAHGDCYAPEDAVPGEPCECVESPDPECEGATCQTYVPCNPTSLCIDPVCVTTAEGGGLCVEGATPCGGLPRCPGGTGDCPPGWICAVQTCCVDPVCVPPEAFCPEAGAAPMTERIELPADYVGARIGTLTTVVIERKR